MLDDQLAALAVMSPAQLRLEWGRVYDTPVPNIAPKLLTIAIAYRLQEKVHGGLAASIVRELMRGKSDMASSPPTRPAIRPGARLVRTWQGRTVSVLVTDDGYRWEDRSYRSLSRIAREVTGAHWSGPRFFGLVGHG